MKPQSPENSSTTSARKKASSRNVSRRTTLGSILCVKAKRTNSRIKSQSGAFLLFGHEAVLPDEGQDGISINRITITNKVEILKQLDRLNINATTVYPSIEQTAVHLKEQYRTASTPLTSASG